MRCVREWGRVLLMQQKGFLGGISGAVVGLSVVVDLMVFVLVGLLCYVVLAV